MSPKAAFALAHPVFDPATQILPAHTSWVDRLVSACLTVNIGME
jgi:hypothetical protein